jgi:hypothetical protein
VDQVAHPVEGAGHSLTPGPLIADFI